MPPVIYQSDSQSALAKPQKYQIGAPISELSTTLRGMLWEMREFAKVTNTARCANRIDCISRRLTDAKEPHKFIQKKFALAVSNIRNGR